MRVVGAQIKYTNRNKSMNGMQVWYDISMEMATEKAGSRLNENTLSSTSHNASYWT